MGQADVIALYSDAAYTNCTMVDTSPQMVSVYVVHENTSGVMASQFRVTTATGAGLSYLSETSPHPTRIGDTQSGLSVAYGGCQYSTVLIATISYFANGASAVCSSVRVVADFNAPTGKIEVVDCSAIRSEGIGGKLVINPDGSCDCGPDTRLTSWGKIKEQFGD
jgi:hypothetical protein